MHAHTHTHLPLFANVRRLLLHRYGHGLHAGGQHDVGLAPRLAEGQRAQHASLSLQRPHVLGDPLQERPQVGNGGSDGGA